MKKLLVTPDNGNGIIVDMTAEEVALKEQDDANSKTRNAEYKAAHETHLSNQASGNQKLLDLGLTQAEVTSLTGYTPPVE